MQQHNIILSLKLIIIALSITDKFPTVKQCLKKFQSAENSPSHSETELQIPIQETQKPTESLIPNVTPVQETCEEQEVNLATHFNQVLAIPKEPAGDHGRDRAYSTVSKASSASSGFLEESIRVRTMSTSAAALRFSIVSNTSSGFFDWERTLSNASYRSNRSSGFYERKDSTVSILTVCSEDPADTFCTSCKIWINNISPEQSPEPSHFSDTLLEGSVGDEPSSKLKLHVV